MGEAEEDADVVFVGRTASSASSSSSWRRARTNGSRWEPLSRRRHVRPFSAIKDGVYHLGPLDYPQRPHRAQALLDGCRRQSDVAISIGIGRREGQVVQDLRDQLRRPRGAPIGTVDGPARLVGRQVIVGIYELDAGIDAYRGEKYGASPS